MNIEIRNFKKGAENAKGLCVIIDVFRACSVLCYVANKNPNKIIVSNNIEQIKKIKSMIKGAIVIGKNHNPNEIIFNMNNSPTEVENNRIENKTIIQHSEGGVNGIVLSNKAEEVITGGFVNALAIANYIKKMKFKTITLVCMGHLGESSSVEDTLCAEYIRSILTGNKLDENQIKAEIKATTGSFFFKGNENLPESDFSYCMNFNRFNFILKRVIENNTYILTKIEL